MGGVLRDKTLHTLRKALTSEISAEQILQNYQNGQKGRFACGELLR